ncbi:MAG: hypothetical protein JW982_14490 [Spirochaetes bacterium]|nr:hypothetical protein [Spirochaetota bacterium]
MKRITLIILITVFFTSTSAFAINKNQSLEYGRTLTRTASTDVDAAFFNPAGLSYLGGDGFYFQVANQMIFQDRVAKTDDYKTISGTDEYVGEIRAWLFPTVAAAYQMGNLTPFFHFGPVNGGSGGHYANGTPEYYSSVAAYNDPCAMTFDGEQSVLAGTLGLAYKISEMFSVAAGYRLSYYSAEYEGKIKGLNVGTGDQGNIAFSYAQDGIGHTLIIGFDIKPIEKLNLGFKVEWSPVWEIEQKDTKLTATGYTGIMGVTNAYVENAFSSKLSKDGDKTNAQEPLSLWFGADYQIMEKLSATVGVIWEMHTQNDLTDDEQDDKTDNIFSSIAFEYAILDQLRASLGYAYETGSNTDKIRSSTNMGLPAHHIALGAGYLVTENIELGIGYVLSNYVESENEAGWKYYYDYAHDISFGVTAKF